MPEDLVLRKLHRLLSYDERQSAEKGKNNWLVIKVNKCAQKLDYVSVLFICSYFDWTDLRGQWQLIAPENDGSSKEVEVNTENKEPLRCSRYVNSSKQGAAWEGEHVLLHNYILAKNKCSQ